MAGGGSNTLRAVLKELGWSRTRLVAELRRQAASSGESLPGTESVIAMVSRWVNNHQQPSDFYRDLLARTLGRPRAELFSDEAARLELAAEAEPASAGIDARPQRLAADSGYWSIANVSGIPGAPELLIPPARHGRHGKPRKDGKPSESKSDHLRMMMLASLGSEQGKACYAQRSRTIEPVFGQVKTVQDGGRFMRRGLEACQAEWKLLCGTHNLLKLWRTTTATSS
jgi:hypothetical protein